MPQPLTRPLDARSARTRERLLDAAERLYASHGIDGTSLREIRISAGQRNSSALHYHFGDAGGVLLALAERHLPRLGAIAEHLRAELAPAGGGAGPAALLEVMVRPWTDYLADGPSARAWIRIAAETSARPERAWDDFSRHAPTPLVEVGAELLGHLEADLGPRLALDRLARVNLAALHLCADRARQVDSDGGSELLVLDHEGWAADLIETSVAAALAPSRRSAYRVR